MAVPLKATSSMYSSQCSSSPTSSSTKLKALVQTLIFSQVCRLIREISRASSIIIRVLRKKQYNLLSLSSSFYPKRTSKKQKSKIIFGSFRLHYNFCSSHVVPPVSAPVRLPEELYLAHLQYDSTWDQSMCSTESMDVRDAELKEPPRLSSYLRDLEDKCKDGEEEGKEMVMMNEIDKLADLFIANCHEKFMLEKVDSYRRFQEMLNTSS